MIESVGAQYVDLVGRLHENWTPHPGQINVGYAVFKLNKKVIFVQCGRKWGKSEIAAYFLWRMAQSFPGSPNYFIGPFQKQTREIMWASKRLQQFGPEDWVSGVNESEMRITFKNGSFIKVDGSDNHDAYRGVEYKGIVYEEYKDQDPRFKKAMRPNAAVLDGIDMFIGSPPDGTEPGAAEYLETADECRNDPENFFIHAPSWQNPHISTKWLINEKARLYRKGEGDVWEREYAAQVVKGGKKAIFPMIHNYEVTPHRQIQHEIARDFRKLRFFWLADPGTATCFAVLFVAWNQYTGKVYLLDEIYETDQAETSVGKIGPRIFAKEKEHGEIRGLKAEWEEYYDEAAAWFQQELYDQFQRYPNSTDKIAGDKQNQLSLIKDMMLRGLLVISENCKKLRWEMELYIKDERGRIPKKNDHMIDNLRAFVRVSGYALNGEDEPMEREKSEDFRGARMEDDFPQLKDFRESDI
jgi:hypothetical protein